MIVLLIGYIFINQSSKKLENKIFTKTTTQLSDQQEIKQKINGKQKKNQIKNKNTKILKPREVNYYRSLIYRSGNLDDIPEKVQVWKKDKKIFTDLFRDIMLDPEKAEQSMWGKLREIYSDIGLDLNSHIKFKSDFKDFYLNIIEQYQESLRGDDPNYKKMSSVTLNYYKKLDSFIEQYHGKNKAMDYKAKKNESRAEFLARLKFYENQ
jgi:hypothetical protein